LRRYLANDERQWWARRLAFITLSSNKISVCIALDPPPITDLDNETNRSPDECSDGLLLGEYIKDGCMIVDCDECSAQFLHERSSACVTVITSLPGNEKQVIEPMKFLPQVSQSKGLPAAHSQFGVGDLPV
jgi:hypothetical protein